jgi:hypothetical protein
MEDQKAKSIVNSEAANIKGAATAGLHIEPSRTLCGDPPTKALMADPVRFMAVTLVAIALSVGAAEASRSKHVHHTKTTKHAHRHKVTVTKHVQKKAVPQENSIPMCSEGQQVSAACACGTDASGRPFMCQEAQWCRFLAHACTQ